MFDSKPVRVHMSYRCGCTVQFPSPGVSDPAGFFRDLLPKSPTDGDVYTNELVRECVYCRWLVQTRGEHSRATVQYEVKASFEVLGKRKPKRVTKKFNDILEFNRYCKNLDENPFCLAYTERMELLTAPGYLYTETK